MNITEVTKDGAAPRPINGLHDAKVGDIIQIGIQGTRHKLQTKIAKVVANDRLMDQEGNIFDRSGRIYRRKGYELSHTKGNIVSAQHITQKTLDQEHRARVNTYLNKYNWHDLDDERIDQILQILRVSFGDRQKRRGFK